MVFPKSNLSTASQPWGRFVEKSITGLETVVATDRVNNAARDAQAALNIKRLDASLAQVASLGLQTAQNVADIQTITDSVFSLNTDVNSLESNVYATGTTQINGFNIKAGTINANAINAGELTGFTIKTASSGTRLELSGSTLDIYYGSTKVGVLSGTGTYGSEASLLIPGTSIGVYVEGSSNSVRLDATNSYVQASTGAARISGGGTSVYVNSSGAFVTKGLYLSGSDNISGNSSSSQGPLVVSDSTGSYMKFDGNEISQYGSSLYLNGSGASGDVVLAAGGGSILAKGAYGKVVTSSIALRIGPDGTLGTSTSSARFKQDIQDAELDINAILSMSAKKFRYKETVTQLGDAAPIVYGFIAEDADTAGLKGFVHYDENNEVFAFDYANYVVALQTVVKYQNDIINDLSNRVTALEGK